MPKLGTCLWFNDQAEEAAALYTSVFKNSKVTGKTNYGENVEQIPSRPKPGSVMTVSFELCGREFLGLNGGPVFTLSPAISFFVSCKDEAEFDAIHAKLTPGGQVLMPLGEYPFSKKFTWFNDKFGVSWQMTLSGEEQSIAPCLMFHSEHFGKAREAMEFYVSQFADSRIDMVVDTETGHVRQALFHLQGEPFRCMDSEIEHAFNFSPAISFIASCANQAEIDKYWDSLAKGGQLSHCGWLTDKFGIAWQVVPDSLGKMMLSADKEQRNRLQAALFQMVKLDEAALKNAFESCAV